MRVRVETFAAALLDHVKTSDELTIILNYDYKNSSWSSIERQTLERLKLAIKYKQKKFVAHSNVQQLLGTIWYEGVPGFRRKNLFGQTIQVIKMSTMVFIYCIIYVVAPKSRMGSFIKNPFVKFICHSSSYVFFLMLLGAASQKFEIVLMERFGTTWMLERIEEWKKKERGGVLGFAESGVIIFVASKICRELKKLYKISLREYILDLWNIVDFITNTFFVIWFGLRMSCLYITWRDELSGKNPWYPREQWDSFEPMLISEGAFAAGMIFSFLKLVHIFSVNPHLGPLQISLGRMIIDIVKFFFIYSLVLFAFGCGLNQLLWYYAVLEKNKCYHLPSGSPDFDNHDKACSIWRRYANLFETSQSLFWASFGLVDLMSFELTGIKTFTRFWALLIFGSYSIINIIVLLNMLIAMMSNSFQMISERADTEWKFARSKLWMNYFEDDEILPLPFNLLQNANFFCKRRQIYDRHFCEGLKSKAKEKHEVVVKLLIKRYITAEQSKRHEYGVTEDDVIEIRQDISSVRYEIIDILRKNGMDTPNISFDDGQFLGRKGRINERRILNDFYIGIAKAIENNRVKKEGNDTPKKSRRKSVLKKKKKDWNALVRQNQVFDPIGSSKKQQMSEFRARQENE